MNPIEKLTTLFFHPGQFFDKIKNEDNILTILLYYACTSAIAVVLVQIITLITQAMLGAKITILQLVGLMFSTIISIGFSFVTPFIIAGIYHLGVLLVKGTGGYLKTFTVSTYVHILILPYSIVSTIPQIFLMNAINAPIFPMYGMELTKQANDPMQIALWLIPIVVIGLAACVHAVWAMILGFTKYHKISKGRAFIAAFVVPLSILIIIGVFIGLLMLLVMSAIGLG